MKFPLLILSIVLGGVQALSSDKQVNGDGRHMIQPRSSPPRQRPNQQPPSPSNSRASTTSSIQTEHERRVTEFKARAQSAPPITSFRQGERIADAANQALIDAKQARARERASLRPVLNNMAFVNTPSTSRGFRRQHDKNSREAVKATRSHAKAMQNLAILGAHPGFPANLNDELARLSVSQEQRATARKTRQKLLKNNEKQWHLEKYNARQGPDNPRRDELNRMIEAKKRNGEMAVDKFRGQYDKYKYFRGQTGHDSDSSQDWDEIIPPRRAAPPGMPPPGGPPPAA